MHTPPSLQLLAPSVVGSQCSFSPHRHFKLCENVQRKSLCLVENFFIFGEEFIQIFPLSPLFLDARESQLPSWERKKFLSHLIVFGKQFELLYTRHGITHREAPNMIQQQPWQ
jgi:hypothetical protein